MREFSLILWNKSTRVAVPLSADCKKCSQFLLFSPRSSQHPLPVRYLSLTFFKHYTRTSLLLLGTERPPELQPTIATTN